MRIGKGSLFISFAILLLLSVSITTPAVSQECGPSCPVCSGTGSATGALVPRGNLIISNIAIPYGEEETYILNLRAGVFPWMDIGVGYAFTTRTPVWSIRLQPLKEEEDDWKPGLLIGTGSVRTGSNDQSLFMQVLKSWEFSEDFALQINGGIALLIPGFDRLYGLAGITTVIKEKWSIFTSYDGINYHFGCSWIPTEFLAISTMLVEAKDLAISMRYILKFGKDSP